jgi:MYXO-CTERM domain-containing protein
MRHGTIAFILAFLAAPAAHAKVLVTQVQPNPKGENYLAQWIEVQNTSTVAVSIAGWTLNDYVGVDPSGESTTRWAFPPNTMLGANAVIVVARQSDAFQSIFGMRPTFELADGSDDMNTPNLVATGGAEFIQLAPERTGDAVALRDAMGAFVSGAEWGTIDRSIPGIPESEVPLAACMPAANCPLGQALVRVSDTGSSNADFIVTNTPKPGAGYAPLMGPRIRTLPPTPSHLGFRDDLAITTEVTDPSGVTIVNVHLAIATSSRGAASQDYVELAMTSSTAPAGPHYTFHAAADDLAAGLGFNEPSTFHDRFVRWYVSAENTLGQDSSDPQNASELASSAAFAWKNVMPSAPSPISDVRAETPSYGAAWPGLSAMVEGVALTTPSVLSPGHTDLAIQDASGWAIRVFDASGMGLGDLTPGTIVRAVGAIGQSHGVMRLSGDATVTVVGAGQVQTSTLTIADLLAAPERYESTLVTIQNLTLTVPAKTWPSGETETMTVKDPTGAISVRITSTNDLAGKAAPGSTFALRGIVSQATADATGTMGSYELVPRSSLDVLSNEKGGGAKSGCSCSASRASNAGFTDIVGVLALALAMIVVRRAVRRRV